MEDIQKKLWKIEQELLDEFHRVCSENGLKYSLAYGTLLGAVRHNGFIPWDDDIDVVMPRKDYDKLIEIWDIKASKGYILQEPYAFPDMVINFAKIRKDHTAFVQTEWEKKKKYHKGIFIDIFPLDRVAPNRLCQMGQKLLCMLAMLFNRGYTSVHKGIIKVCEKLLLDIVPKSKYRKVQKWAERQATRWNNNCNLKWFGFATFEAMQHYYEPNIFEKLTTLEFEGKRYSAFCSYEQILHDEYGNYMQLPPVENRVWKHHPVLLDFDKNYEEIIVSENCDK